MRLTSPIKTASSAQAVTVEKLEEGQVAIYDNGTGGLGISGMVGGKLLHLPITGQAGGAASLNSEGKIPAEQLPLYVVDLTGHTLPTEEYTSIEFSAPLGFPSSKFTQFATGDLQVVLRGVNGQTIRPFSQMGSAAQAVCYFYYYDSAILRLYELVIARPRSEGADAQFSFTLLRLI